MELFACDASVRASGIPNGLCVREGRWPRKVNDELIEVQRGMSLLECEKYGGGSGQPREGSELFPKRGAFYG